MSSPAGPLHQSKVGRCIATVTHSDSNCHPSQPNQHYLVICAWLFVPVIVALLVARSTLLTTRSCRYLKLSNSACSCCWNAVSLALLRKALQSGHCGSGQSCAGIAYPITYLSGYAIDTS